MFFPNWKIIGSVSAFQRNSQHGAHPLVLRKGEGRVVAALCGDGIVDVDAFVLFGDELGNPAIGTGEAILLLAIRISEERVFQHT